jgi:inosine-uridine nucleoside N-ribohydrolase
MAKLVIDCDPGHDDAVAILYAARHHELLGITTVHGNSSLENTTRNALRVLTLAGLDVPVAAGCAGPLVGQPFHASHIHGTSGLDGALLPEPSRGPLETHAVDFLIEIARQHRGELVVAVVGPATNVAVALLREPRLKEWVRAFTVMGGSTSWGNISPAAEFNVYADPEAAAALLASGVPIHLVGLNVTRQVGFSADDLEALRGRGGHTAQTIAALLQFYLERGEDTYGLGVAPMHDSCAIVAHTAPELLSFEHIHVAVELASPLTRGMTVCDLRGYRGTDALTPNAHVAVAADGRAIMAHVLEAVASYP